MTAIPLFADLVDNFGRLAVNCLAVAGGFLVGYFMTALFVAVVWRLLFAGKRKLPEAVKQLLRLAGGILLAILVALFVFGDGDGWGLGRGTGLGGTSDPSAGDKGKDAAPTAKEQPKPKDQPKDVITAPEEGALRVVLLGGNRVQPGGRIFQIENEPGALNLKELQDQIPKRKQAAPRPMKTIELLVYPESVAPALTPEVEQLQRWANSQGLSVKFPPVSGKLP